MREQVSAATAPIEAAGDVVRGPAVPTSAAWAVQRPLGVDAVRITGGPWARWQRLNREVSLPLAFEHLEQAGNLGNLRLAAGETTGAYRGPVFMDSDLYKVLEAVAWELGRMPDEGEDGALSGFLRAATALLERAQGEDGYLNSWVQVVEPRSRYTRLASSHELYCAGHLIQAAVAASRATGDRRLLGVARRFADHLVAVFLRGGHPGIDGHPVVETALVELYRLCGEPAYLELARKFVDQRGKGLVGTSGHGASYLQDHLPVRAADTLVGHAVRALYLESGVVDLYLETGDRSLLEASRRQWDDTVATKTALTGGLGARHATESFGDRYELPPDRGYNETCAAVASVHWSWRLLLATGEARYADLIERTLHNAFAASTSVDGTRFFYVNPLQRRGDHLDGDDRGRRNAWFSCACCPPNVMRLVASLGHYLATTAGDALYLHQFMPAEIDAALPAGRFRLSVTTGYPWSADVDVTVRSAPAGEAALALRVPAWSNSTRLLVAGEERDATPDERGYTVISRRWRPGDSVRLRLDLSPRLTYPHQRIDALRGTVAVERGPLVYCFEQADQPAGVDVEALALPPGTRLRAVPHDQLPGIGRTVTIEAQAAVVEQPRPDGLPYTARPAAELATSRPVTATAIPYFQWDNRDGGAMRVWLPLATPAPDGTTPT
jgi:DUF1680 family protein